MSKHSPAPWYVEERRITGDPYVMDAHDLPVARPLGTDKEELLANGHLIAAAPDLLAVCELAVVNERKADDVRGSGMVDDADIKALRAIARAARAAIAKARNESPDHDRGQEV